MNYELVLSSYWAAACDTVQRHNHQRSNLFAATTLFVRSVFTPEDIESLNAFRQLPPLPFHPPVLPKKDLDQLVSQIVRKLQRIEPPFASTHSLRTLELLCGLAPTRLWATLQTTPSFHHTLPRHLFSDMLPVSQEELFALQSLGLDRMQQRVGSDRFMIEAHADKVAELPRIIEELVAMGRRSLIVVDTELERLAEVDSLLLPVYDFPVHLVYINKSHSVSPALPPYISPSLIHYFYSIANFDEVPQLIEEEITSIHPTILCGFEGVITEREQLRHIQMAVASEEVVKALMVKPTYSSPSIRRNKPRLAPI